MTSIEQMANLYEYNAPQFRDFNESLEDSDEADKFFDIEHEEPSRNDNKENSYPKEVLLKDEIKTPTDNFARKDAKSESRTPLSDLKKPVSNKKRSDMLRKAVRRLSSVNLANADSSDINENLSKELDNVSLRNKKVTRFDGITVHLKGDKTHCMTTRKDEAANTPKLELRTRSVVKDTSDTDNRKRNLAEYELPKAKYIAMAEQILHFQRDTPPRFRTSRRRSSGTHGSMLKARQSYKPRRTIALTPKLMTSLRTRPVEFPSQHEKEVLELEQMKKYQIKANPLNTKVLQSPKLPPKNVKPNTVQEPFHITEVFKKPLPKPEEELFKFTAKPVPKAILQKPVGVGPKKELPITVPQSPAITKTARSLRPIRMPALQNNLKQSTEDLTSFGVPCSKNILSRTEVKPFSFEERDKEMLEKKEKKIQQVLEAEKKAREFKAKPVPAYVSKANRSNVSSISVTSTVAEDTIAHFKARSPRVLRQLPFKPKTEHLHSEPLNIQLNTERRLDQRKQFELKQMEKEEQLAILREQREQEKKQKEEEEIARLRQDTIHKAKPMPKFKPPPKMPASTLPLTDPKSPKFTKRTRTTMSANMLTK